MRLIKLAKGKKFVKTDSRPQRTTNKSEIEIIKKIKEARGTDFCFLFLDIDIQSKFTEHISPKVVYFKEEFMQFASEGLICGLNEDEYNNNDWILNNMEKFDPD